MIRSISIFKANPNLNSKSISCNLKHSQQSFKGTPIFYQTESDIIEQHGAKKAKTIIAKLNLLAEKVKERADDYTANLVVTKTGVVREVDIVINPEYIKDPETTKANNISFWNPDQKAQVILRERIRRAYRNGSLDWLFKRPREETK